MRRSRRTPSYAPLAPARGLRARLRLRRELRQNAKTRERLLADPPFPCLGLADYDGPCWLGGWGATGNDVDEVCLAHGDPLGTHVRITTGTRPLAYLIEDLEDAGAALTDDLEVLIEDMPVTLQRWRGEGGQVAVGRWRGGTVELEGVGVDLEGLRLEVVTDLSPYHAQSPGP